MLKFRTRVMMYTNSLKRRVSIAEDRALYRVAGLVRTATKRSMRRRIGPSSPGTPPHAHTRGGLREIRFVVDTRAKAALVGPLKFPGSNFFNEPVPHVHEFGGGFISRRGFKNYPQRSYMKSTLDKLVASGKIPRQFSVSMGEVL